MPDDEADSQRDDQRRCDRQSPSPTSITCYRLPHRFVHRYFLTSALASSSFKAEPATLTVVVYSAG